MHVAWRLTRLVLGYGCIALGVVGLFLPVLQGVLLLIVGLSLLSTESEWARRYRDQLRRWVARKQIEKKIRGGEIDGVE